MSQEVEIIQAPRVMLTVTEAAKCLSVGRSTLYQLILSGDIETVNIGRLRRVPVDCLVEFVERCRRGAGRAGAVTSWAPEPATSGRRSSSATTGGTTAS